MGFVEEDLPKDDTETQCQEIQWNECNLLAPKAGPRKVAVLSGPANGYFMVCWECYQTTIAPTPLSAFFTTQELPKSRTASCKFAEFWIRFAWRQVLAGKGDVDVMLPPAGLLAYTEQRCPNANLSSDSAVKSAQNRLWFTIVDPETGVLLKQWTICGGCHFQIVKLCGPISEAFQKVSTAPVRATCDLVPKVSSTRSSRCLEELMNCERATQESGEVDMRPLAKFIKRFTGIPACPRDVAPTVPQKFYHLPGASEYPICQDCYLTVIEPEAKEGGVTLAQEVVLSTRPMPGMTCQLYSERMRMIWADAVATSDKAFLLQKLSERRAKETNRQVQTSRLNQSLIQLQGQYEMLNSLSMHQSQFAMNEWSSNSMAYTAASISNMNIFNPNPRVMPALQKPLDLSQSRNTSNQAMMALQEKGRVYEELNTLEWEWKRYWE
ncbi:uncharacterized protein LY89DRAFT_683924 [Mollisia scopiformis]|uniref:Uncharacterized protein n=1 Tax=Mollisia scopiformis TaxID=149040 RepID=A0A194XDX1_MOLSC|nr:uncharacterized protein LY89DRAFT_683924 [Mollisia scopiformis]KUJ17947.1 hypothetical protein LY89DRAFT_683924 [Mollisia scopiformis]